MIAYPEPYAGNGTWKSFTKTWHSKSYPEISPSRPELSVANKVVFITGGGSGIGKATAQAFAAAGARAIAIFGRRVPLLQAAVEEIRAANPQGTTTAVYEGVDLSQREAVDKAFTSALQQIGASHVDVFISNAGVLPAQGAVAGYSEADLRKGLDLTLVASFNAVQAALPLLAPKDAKVLNISSGIGHISAVPGVWLYATQKMALIKMFDYLQAERPDLDVFNVQPGVIDTDMSRQVMESQDDGKSPITQPTENQFLCHCSSGYHSSANHSGTRKPSRPLPPLAHLA